MKKLLTSENDVKDLLKKALARREAWSYAPVQSGMGVSGIPDRIACVPLVVTEQMIGLTIGLFVGVEAKRRGRRGEKNAGATGLQLERLRGILAAGGAAALVDSQEDIDMFLLRIDALPGGTMYPDEITEQLERRIRNRG